MDCFFARFYHLIAAALLFSIAGCAATTVANEEASQGSGFIYRPGYPEIRLTAIGLYDLDGNPGIDVISDVVYGSLVYNKRDNLFLAQILIDVRLVQENVPVPKSYAQTFTFAVSDKNQQITQSQESFQIRRRIPVEPGSYKVYVNIIDQSSKKDSRVETEAEIPDPEVPETFLTDVLIDVRSVVAKGWSSVPTYDLRGDIDSLKFSFQLSKNDFSTGLTLKSRLLKFESDTTPSRPLTGVTPASGLAYWGLVYEKPDTLNETTRFLGKTIGNITFEFPFLRLAPGNYRFEVVLMDENGKTITKARDFGVKTTWYPTLRTIRELAEPLVYLMTEREFKKMMRIENPDSLKRYVDSFWLKNIQNTTIARNVISLFYTRVEEANKRFSCYKEGWKTDMGMMLILFGPPWMVEFELQQYIWHYGYSRQDRTLIFIFDELRPSGKRHGFKTWALQRRPYYAQLYNSKIQDWLDGTVLTRDI